jgi:outer membrane biosynthesis protein TonB
MAPREMPPARRQHRELLRIQQEGVFTKDDPLGQLNVFRQYQQFGLFPLEYGTPWEMQEALVGLIKSGVPKKEALAQLGIEKDVFESNGKIKGRILRDSTSPALAAAVDSVAGEGTAASLTKSQGRYWNAGVAENREIAPSLGYAVNEGHIDTSASGAPGSNRAAGTESAVINQMNGRSAANPSRPVSATERPNIGVANTHIAGLYEAALQDSGLPARSGTQRLLNPYVSAALGSDEATRYIPEEQLEVFNRTFQDLADQRYNEVAMYDHVVSGGALTPEALAEAGLEKRGVSTFAQAPADAAPVKVLQVDPKVLAAQRRSQAEAARVAAARYGIPAPKPPTPKPPTPKPPTPKPPTPKPTAPKPTAPKPTAPKPASRPVGSRATLNGKPVVWDGKGWKPATPGRASLGSNRSRSPANRSRSPANRSRSPANRSGGTRRPPAAGTTRTRPQSTQFSWDNPLSPLNRNTGMYGGIERRANDAVQDAIGWSPHWLRYAD